MASFCVSSSMEALSSSTSQLPKFSDATPIQSLKTNSLLLKFSLSSSRSKTSRISALHSKLSEDGGTEEGSRLDSNDNNNNVAFSLVSEEHNFPSEGNSDLSQSNQKDMDSVLNLTTPPLVISYGSSTGGGTRAGLFRTPISGGVQSATSAHGLPRPALAVRNLMEQARFAHLCTVMSRMHHHREGYPFGSLVDFAADPSGHPIFSFSPLAIHTRNLLADPRCTLVVQIPGWSGLSNARVTIFGDVYPLPEGQQEWAHKQYMSKHQQGPSQQWGNFFYFRMQNIRFLSGVAPPPLLRNSQPNGSNMRAFVADNSPRQTVNSTIPGPRRKFVDEGKLRKVSERLFSDSGQRRSMRLAGESVVNTNSCLSVSGNGTSHSSKFLGGSKLISVASRSLTYRKGQSWTNENADEGIHHEVHDDSRSSIPASNSSPSVDNRLLEEGLSRSSGAAVLSGSRYNDGASEIFAILRLLGDGFRLFCLSRCKDALDVFIKLPQKHYNTGWVLSLVGKAYFEMVDYLEADTAFSLARIASPHSLEGMDIYSTVLYHLKEDMKLSYLAQELVATDRLAPQSWCAMGNCYSLQRDHETALKNFQRSVQLNSRFAYAHTLCGHEYVSLEDFENGIKSYQSALMVDSRHYNAWYGLGMIYLRQEKFEFSEHHFRMAFRINPLSSVIMSYLGTALHALKKNNEALEMMERAILADKKNPLPLYQKANILVSMENLDGALAVLKELKEYAPCESGVYALMGRIYKRRNMHDKAMLHFGLALDLKPSATDVAAIKAAIEKLHVPDELEDVL